MLSTKNQTLVLKGGLIAWTLWVVMNYLIHHPSHYYAISSPPYFSVIIILVLLSVGAFFLQKKEKFKLRGWKIYSFVLLAMMLVFHAFAKEASVYTGAIGRAQLYFLANILLLHLGTFLIFTSCYVAGSLVLKRFEKQLNTHQEKILSIALGMAMITFLLFLFAALGLLQTIFVAPVIILLLAWRWKYSWAFIKYVFWNPIRTKGTSHWTFAIVMVVLAFTAFNLVGSIKIFPLGYDGASLYQNITKNLVDSHQLIKGSQAFSWSLFTSIGPLLFGAMAFSIFLSHFMGVLCMWAMFHLGRIFLSRSASWIAVAIFYTLPALGYHHFVDEKVDVGFLFICISIFILLLRYAASVKYDFSIQNKTTIWFFSLLGVLLGFAMGIKYLGLLLFVGVVSMLIYQWGGIKAYLGMLLITLSALFVFKINDFGYLDITDVQRYMIIGISGLSGIGVLLFFAKQFNRSKGISIAKNIAILSAVFLLSFSPWGIKNIIETGSFSSKSFLYGKVEQNTFDNSYVFLANNNIPFKIPDQYKQRMLEYMGKDPSTVSLSDEDFIHYFKEMKAQNKGGHSRANSSLRGDEKTGKREEILRYLGYEKGANRYLSLPYDVSMGINIPNRRGIDVGFLFLLFLPLLVLSLKKKNGFTIKNGIGILVFSLVLLLSWKAVVNVGDIRINVADHLVKYTPGPNQGLKAVANDLYLPFLNLQDNISLLTQPLFSLFSKMTFPITFFMLILGCLLMAWIAKDNWRKYEKPIKLLVVFILSYGFLWWILGNGIPYYAFVIWMLSSILIAYFYENISLFTPKNLDVFFRKWAQIVFGAFITLNLLVHFSNNSNNWKEMQNVFFAPFMAHYSTHLLNNDILESSKVIITPASTLLNNDIEAKIYRVGTFMNYHIVNNNTRVYEDTQLSLFDKISKMLQNPDDFITVLKLNAVRYIVFDLKVATIDQTPEKSLLDKAARMVKVLNNKERIRLVMTNNRVRRVDPATNKEKIVYGLAGEMVKQGDIAIFEIIE